MVPRELHIIYTEADVILSKARFSSWQEIQAAYPSYKASLGPWSEAEVADFLASEYSELLPVAAEQVRLFSESSEESWAVRFCGVRDAA